MIARPPPQKKKKKKRKKDGSWVRETESERERRKANTGR
jgi:hypothetical protein